jgi:hypothetical protein
VMAKKKTPYWHTAIEAAKRRGTFLAVDVRRAESWISCACGKQDKSIPRYTRKEADASIRPVRAGMPKDRVLADLGVSFLDSVEFNDPESAARVLTSIEKRAAKILARAK